MRATRILVVEDEEPISDLIAINLRHNGYEPVCTGDGFAAQQAMEQTLPDAIVLDWMLPGQSGIDLARAWRRNPRTKDIPILMLTARSDEPDKIAGLDAGADDYLTKPFSVRELLARLRAILRRRPAPGAATLQIGQLTLDKETHRATWAGQELKLSHTEFKLLSHLMQNPERVHTRASLLDKIWGEDVFIEERTVDVQIKRLRSTLGEAAPMLETVRGVGYRLSAKGAL